MNAQIFSVVLRRNLQQPQKPNDHQEPEMFDFMPVCMLIPGEEKNLFGCVNEHGHALKLIEKYLDSDQINEITNSINRWSAGLWCVQVIVDSYNATFGGPESQSIEDFQESLERILVTSC